jgi:hypothetical protein
VAVDAAYEYAAFLRNMLKSADYSPSRETSAWVSAPCANPQSPLIFSSINLRKWKPLLVR